MVKGHTKNNTNCLSILNYVSILIDWADEMKSKVDIDSFS